MMIDGLEDSSGSSSDEDWLDFEKTYKKESFKGRTLFHKRPPGLSKKQWRQACGRALLETESPQNCRAPTVRTGSTVGEDDSYLEAAYQAALAVRPSVPQNISFGTKPMKADSGKIKAPKALSSDLMLGFFKGLLGPNRQEEDSINGEDDAKSECSDDSHNDESSKPKKPLLGKSPKGKSPGPGGSPVNKKKVPQVPGMEGSQSKIFPGKKGVPAPPSAPTLPPAGKEVAPPKRRRSSPSPPPPSPSPSSPPPPPGAVVGPRAALPGASQDQLAKASQESAAAAGEERPGPAAVPLLEVRRASSESPSSLRILGDRSFGSNKAGVAVEVEGQVGTRLRTSSGGGGGGGPAFRPIRAHRASSSPLLAGGPGMGPPAQGPPGPPRGGGGGGEAAPLSPRRPAPQRAWAEDDAAAAGPLGHCPPRELPPGGGEEGPARPLGERQGSSRGIVFTVDRGGGRLDRAEPPAELAPAGGGTEPSLVLDIEAARVHRSISGSQPTPIPTTMQAQKKDPMATRRRSIREDSQPVRETEPRRRSLSESNPTPAPTPNTMDGRKTLPHPDRPRHRSLSESNPTPMPQNNKETTKDKRGSTTSSISTEWAHEEGQQQPKEERREQDYHPPPPQPAVRIKTSESSSFSSGFLSSFSLSLRSRGDGPKSKEPPLKDIGGLQAESSHPDPDQLKKSDLHKRSDLEGPQEGSSHKHQRPGEGKNTSPAVTSSRQEEQQESDKSAVQRPATEEAASVQPREHGTPPPSLDGPSNGAADTHPGSGGGAGRPAPIDTSGSARRGRGSLSRGGSSTGRRSSRSSRGGGVLSAGGGRRGGGGGRGASALLRARTNATAFLHLPKHLREEMEGAVCGEEPGEGEGEGEGEGYMLERWKEGSLGEVVNPRAGQFLLLHIIEANDLPSASLFGGARPYLVARYGWQARQTAAAPAPAARRGRAGPARWDAPFAFAARAAGTAAAGTGEAPPPAAAAGLLRLDCYHRDLLADSYLGGAELSTELNENNTLPFEVKLMGGREPGQNNGKECGTLKLKLFWTLPALKDKDADASDPLGLMNLLDRYLIITVYSATNLQSLDYLTTPAPCVRVTAGEGGEGGGGGGGGGGGRPPLRTAAAPRGAAAAAVWGARLVAEVLPHARDRQPRGPLFEVVDARGGGLVGDRLLAAAHLPWGAVGGGRRRLALAGPGAGAGAELAVEAHWARPVRPAPPPPPPPPPPPAAAAAEAEGEGEGAAADEEGAAEGEGAAADEEGAAAAAGVVGGEGGISGRGERGERELKQRGHNSSTEDYSCLSAEEDEGEDAESEDGMPDQTSLSNISIMNAKDLSSLGGAKCAEAKTAHQGEKGTSSLLDQSADEQDAMVCSKLDASLMAGAENIPAAKPGRVSLEMNGFLGNPFASPGPISKSRQLPWEPMTDTSEDVSTSYDEEQQRGNTSEGVDGYLQDEIQSESHEEKDQHLLVAVIGADHLGITRTPKPKSLHPYVRLRISGLSECTTIKDKTRCPIWNQCFMLPISNALKYKSDGVSLEVYHSTREGAGEQLQLDPCLGTALLKWDQITLTDTELEMPLQQDEGIIKKGKLYIKVSWHPNMNWDFKQGMRIMRDIKLCEYTKECLELGSKSPAQRRWQKISDRRLALSGVRAFLTEREAGRRVSSAGDHNQPSLLTVYRASNSKVDAGRMSLPAKVMPYGVFGSPGINETVAKTEPQLILDVEEDENYVSSEELSPGSSLLSGGFVPKAFLDQVEKLQLTPIASHQGPNPIKFRIQETEARVITDVMHDQVLRETGKQSEPSSAPSEPNGVPASSLLPRPVSPEQDSSLVPCGQSLDTSFSVERERSTSRSVRAKELPDPDEGIKMACIPEVACPAPAREAAAEDSLLGWQEAVLDGLHKEDGPEGENRAGPKRPSRTPPKPPAASAEATGAPPTSEPPQALGSTRRPARKAPPPPPPAPAPRPAPGALRHRGAMVVAGRRVMVRAEEDPALGVIKVAAVDPVHGTRTVVALRGPQYGGAGASARAKLRAVAAQLAALLPSPRGGTPPAAGPGFPVLREAPSPALCDAEGSGGEDGGGAGGPRFSVGRPPEEREAPADPGPPPTDNPLAGRRLPVAPPDYLRFATPPADAHAPGWEDPPFTAAVASPPQRAAGQPGPRPLRAAGPAAAPAPPAAHNSGSPERSPPPLPLLPPPPPAGGGAAPAKRANGQPGLRLELASPTAGESATASPAVSQATSPTGVTGSHLRTASTGMETVTLNSSNHSDLGPPTSLTANLGANGYNVTGGARIRGASENGYHTTDTQDRRRNTDRDEHVDSGASTTLEDFHDSDSDSARGNLLNRPGRISGSSGSGTGDLNGSSGGVAGLLGAATLRNTIVRNGVTVLDQTISLNGESGGLQTNGLQRQLVTGQRRGRRSTQGGAPRRGSLSSASEGSVGAGVRSESPCDPLPPGLLASLKKPVASLSQAEKKAERDRLLLLLRDGSGGQGDGEDGDVSSDEGGDLTPIPAPPRAEEFYGAPKSHITPNGAGLRPSGRPPPQPPGRARKDSDVSSLSSYGEPPRVAGQQASNENDAGLTRPPIRSASASTKYGSLVTLPDWATVHAGPGGGPQFCVVQLLEATALPVEDLAGKCDPYVRVSLGGQVAVSDVKKATLAPVWNRLYSFHCGGEQKDAAPGLRFELWNHNVFGEHEFIGQALLGWRDLTGRAVELPLLGGPRAGAFDRSVRGTLRVGACWAAALAPEFAQGMEEPRSLGGMLAASPREVVQREPLEYFGLFSPRLFPPVPPGEEGPGASERKQVFEFPDVALPTGPLDEHEGGPPPPHSGISYAALDRELDAIRWHRPSQPPKKPTRLSPFAGLLTGQSMAPPAAAAGEQRPVEAYLVLGVLCARRLPRVDVLGLCDPYVVVRLGAQHQRTSVARSTLYPVWDQAVVLEVRRGDRARFLGVTAEVWDWDMVGRHNYVGQVRLAWAELEASAGAERAHWVARGPAPGRTGGGPGGLLRLRADWAASAEAARAVMREVLAGRAARREATLRNRAALRLQRALFLGPRAAARRRRRAGPSAAAREAAAAAIQRAWVERVNARVMADLQAQAARDEAAVAVQSAYRGHLARRFLRAERQLRGLEAREDGAAALQRLFRGRRARRGLAGRHAAATAVQRVARGRAGARRARGRREQRAAGVIQRAFIMHMFRQVLRFLALRRRQEAAALKIQRVYRGHNGRWIAFEARQQHQYERELASEQQEAALTLQCAVRGCKARAEAGGRRRRHRAAARLQLAWLAHRARARVGALRRAVLAAVKLQAVARGHLGRGALRRRRAREEAAAAFARQQALRDRAAAAAAAVHLQRAGRGLLGRRRAAAARRARAEHAAARRVAGAVRAAAAAAAAGRRRRARARERAARGLQAAHRGARGRAAAAARRRARRRVEAAVVLQAYARQIMAVWRVDQLRWNLRREKAAITLQCAARCVMALQETWRRHHEWERGEAARAIQGRARVYLAKKAAGQRRSRRDLLAGVVRLQAAWRGALARGAARARRAAARREAAAGACQRVARGRAGRRRAAARRRVRLEAAAAARRAAAAVACQRVARGHLARLRVGEVVALRAILLVQRAVRGLLGRARARAVRAGRARAAAAAVGIQALARGRQARRRRRKRRSFTKKIGRIHRLPNYDYRWDPCATIIQCLIRQRRARRAVEKLRLEMQPLIEEKKKAAAASKIQACCRVYFVKRAKWELVQQVVVLQRFWRASQEPCGLLFSTRRGRNLKLALAVEQVQRMRRRSCADIPCITAEEFDRRIAFAVTKIQCFARARQARGFVSCLRASRKLMEDERRSMAALSIQSWARSQLTRRGFRELNDLVTLIQIWYRGRRADQLAKKKQDPHRAATLIQSTYRGYLIKKGFTYIANCIIVIQRFWRASMQPKGYLFITRRGRNLAMAKAVERVQTVRKSSMADCLEGLPCGEVLEHVSGNAAIKIQSTVRCHLAKSRVAQIRVQRIQKETEERVLKQEWAALSIQCYVRSWFTRRALVELKSVVVFIQRWYRGIKARQQEEHMRARNNGLLNGICRMQAVTRGRIYRRRLARGVWAVRVLQRRQRLWRLIHVVKSAVFAKGMTKLQAITRGAIGRKVYEEKKVEAMPLDELMDYIMERNAQVKQLYLGNRKLLFKVFKLYIVYPEQTMTRETVLQFGNHFHLVPHVAQKRVLMEIVHQITRANRRRASAEGLRKASLGDLRRGSVAAGGGGRAGGDPLRRGSVAAGRGGGGPREQARGKVLVSFEQFLRLLLLLAFECYAAYIDPIQLHLQGAGDRHMPKSLRGVAFKFSELLRYMDQYEGKKKGAELKRIHEHVAKFTLLGSKHLPTEEQAARYVSSLRKELKQVGRRGSVFQAMGKRTASLASASSAGSTHNSSFTGSMAGSRTGSMASATSSRRGSLASEDTRASSERSSRLGSLGSDAGLVGGGRKSTRRRRVAGSKGKPQLGGRTPERRTPPEKKVPPKGGNSYAAFLEQQRASEASLPQESERTVASDVHPMTDVEIEALAGQGDVSPIASPVVSPRGAASDGESTNPATSHSSLREQALGRLAESPTFSTSDYMATDFAQGESTEGLATPNSPRLGQVSPVANMPSSGRVVLDDAGAVDPVETVDSPMADQKKVNQVPKMTKAQALRHAKKMEEAQKAKMAAASRKDAAKRFGGKTGDTPQKSSIPQGRSKSGPAVNTRSRKTGTATLGATGQRSKSLKGQEGAEGAAPAAAAAAPSQRSSRLPFLESTVSSDRRTSRVPSVNTVVSAPRRPARGAPSAAAAGEGAAAGGGARRPPTSSGGPRMTRAAQLRLQKQQQQQQSARR